MTDGVAPSAPLIVDVKANSLDDGPGIRSVVFFKGCPLACSWCHNPETKSRRAELSFDTDRCVGSAECVSRCGAGALSFVGGALNVDRERCTACFECVDPCPSGALSRVGDALSVDELTARLLRDRAFFENSGGGVTVSGGEPTVHMEFLAELLRRLKSEHVHTLLQTCGAFALSTFEARVYPHLDLIHFDLKLFDPTAHQAYCGADNERILQNFARLVALARGGGVPVLARVPLVPGVTAEPRNLGALAAFLREQGVAEVQLMPYNPLWPTKTRQLGRAPSAHAQAATWMDPAELAQCAQVFRRSDIQVLGRLQRG